jgi:hypothetical protein
MSVWQFGYTPFVAYVLQLLYSIIEQFEAKKKSIAALSCL